MEPIRILHVIGGMNRGGAETMIMNFYRKIDRNKVQFDFMVNTKEKCDYNDEILSLGGNIYYIPKFNGLNFIQYKMSLRRFFKEHQEHKIIHGHIGSSAAMYLHVANKYNKFTIAHSHNTKNSNKTLKSFLWRVYSYPTRYIANYFFGCSLAAGIDRFGKKVVHSSDFCVLNNAIDSKKFIFSDKTREEVRTDLSIQDKFVIGHIGRFDKQKNHEFLIEIFNEFSKKIDNSVLLLVGDGDLRNQIEEKVKNLGLYESVIFAGVREDVPDLLQAMDVFVFPSLFEGLGIVVVEAQASGLPCVISDKLPEESILIDDLVTIQSLDQSAELWAEHIISRKGNERISRCEEITACGYDISETAKWLEEFYLEKYERQ